MHHRIAPRFPSALLALTALSGGLFCAMHLFNGWLLSNFEISQHISLVYLPSFLRLANVLVLGMVWGTAATATGGLMLLWWSSESWGLALCNVMVSAGGAALAVFMMQILLQRRLSLRKLSDLLRLALLYALLNALGHHWLWSVLDPSQLVDPNQVIYMTLGDINGAVIGALVLRWVAHHTAIIQFARRRAMADKTSPHSDAQGSNNSR
jgi:hypothetical protein